MAFVLAGLASLVVAVPLAVSGRAMAETNERLHRILDDLGGAR